MLKHKPGPFFSISLPPPFFFFPCSQHAAAKQTAVGRQAPVGFGNAMNLLNHVEGWSRQLTTAALPKKLAGDKDASTLNCCSAVNLHCMYRWI